MHLQINPDIDTEAAAQRFSAQGYVQIPDFLTAASADAVYDVLARKTEWQLAISDATGKPQLISTAQAQSDATRVRDLITDNTRRAGEQFAYFYLCYPMIQTYLAQTAPDHPLNSVTEFLNSPEMIAFGQKVSHHPDVRKLDAQATCFRPNDFLNLHDDLDRGHRVAAYTLGFTRDWRSDWGGQLLMHTEDGDVRLGLKPRFNTLTLFRVPVVHSVAPVAPYARHPRYSVTGWLLTE